ncbi:hypothetical protein [Synechococcus sp. BIOS-E4-1]|uniref:hypothetical protein n=1 Tax=Synechococcus sp. BIOS-E4-1 TaxID=1400864 RepID=UPI001648889D|nr:hypothetical protein [Synechococcus sp. BIOS-E4-1]
MANLIQALQASGLNPRQVEEQLQKMGMMAANNSMSQSDRVVRTVSEPDAPGTYITAEQNMQAQFEQTVAGVEAMNRFKKVSQYEPPIPIVSPNTTVMSNGTPISVDTVEYIR